MEKSNLNNRPSLVVATEEGDIVDVPELAMAGRSGYEFLLPESDDLISLPEGSEIYQVPERVAVGLDRSTGELRVLNTYRGRHVMPVATFIAPAYTLLYLSSFFRTPEAAPLPLFNFGAIGWHEQGFVAAAQRVDPDIRQDADQHDPVEINKHAEYMLQRYPQNRLVSHLVENCVRRYWCPAARNFVMGRWEMPLPVSPSCNARCAGCISLQQEGKPRPPQDRIKFVPTAEEIAEIAVPHLERAERAIASFGQGCEGEPLMNATLLEHAIKRIRRKTDRGTINLNTNGSRPGEIERLFNAGLDSIRVSLNSAIPDLYTAYFQPLDYEFGDVIETLKLARELGLFTSINYFVFPGVTDREEEKDALESLIQSTGLCMIQWRNLCIDPDDYLDIFGGRLTEKSNVHIGMRRLIEHISSRYPEVRQGYFNPPLK